MVIVIKIQDFVYMKENLEIVDFVLLEDEMMKILGLNKNRCFNDLGVFCEVVFNIFFLIYDQWICLMEC